MHYSWRPHYFIRHCTSRTHVTIYPSRRWNASHGIIHNGKRRNRLYRPPGPAVIRTRRLSSVAFSQVIIFLRTHHAEFLRTLWEPSYLVTSARKFGRSSFCKKRRPNRIKRGIKTRQDETTLMSETKNLSSTSAILSIKQKFSALL